MITANFQKLKGVSVATRSGSVIGSLRDFQLDLDTLKVAALIITPAGLLKNLMMEEVVIPVHQIVEVSTQKIIVEDAVSRDRGMRILAKDFGKNIAADTGSISSSEQPQS